MIIKTSFIRKQKNGKFRVVSRKGKNLGEYSSREEALRRLKQIEFFKHKKSFSRNNHLKVLFSYLLDKSLVKEAGILSSLSKELTLPSILSLIGFAGTVYGANKFFETDVGRSFISEFFTEHGINKDAMKSKFFKKETSLDEIIKDIYHDSSLLGKEDIIKSLIIKANPHIDFSKNKIELKSESLFTQNVEVFYPDLEKIKERFMQILPSGYDSKELQSIKDIKPSEEFFKSLSDTEGYRPTIYNDDSSLVWPKDAEKGSGHWTIGFGHRLKKSELSSGYIKTLDGKQIFWKLGLTKQQGAEILTSDVLKHSVDSGLIKKDIKISRSLYEAMVDLSFNIGPTAFSKFLRTIVNDKGEISSDLFARQISGWTKTNNSSQSNGIVIRRLSELLLAKGILLPSNPKHLLDNEVHKDAVMSYPSTSLVRRYLTTFNIENPKIILDRLSKNPPSNIFEFKKILKSLP